MYYYYKIQNKINDNLYIGITTDWNSRKKRHLSLLRNNKHFNPHLQLSFNKYKEENFSFELIEEKDFENPLDAYLYESVLIKNFDSINKGFNCNPGGLWTGPKGKFSKEHIFYIKSACYYETGITGILAKFYDCAPATINNIRIGRNYKIWCEEFNNLPEEEKEKIYRDFCDFSNFNILKLGKNAKGRHFTKEQIFIILYCDETNFIKFSELRKSFNINSCSYYFENVRSGRDYKDYYAEYQLLTKQEKEKILCRYTEMYK